MRVDFDSGKRAPEIIIGCEPPPWEKAARGRTYKTETELVPAKKEISSTDLGKELLGALKGGDKSEIAAVFEKYHADQIIRVISETKLKSPRTWAEMKIATDMARQSLGLHEKTGGGNALINIRLMSNSEGEGSKAPKPQGYVDVEASEI